MVSSTFYDLKHLRASLGDFIQKSLGYSLLMSELSSFPIDPDLSTVETCRARVQDQADILILIIGARYGSIDSRSDKSVTNLEYLTARAKGIPIYAFVDESILSVLPVWKANPKAKLGTVVDNPRLFEFLEAVRSQVWTNGFTTPSDIIESIRAQLGHLFNESLKSHSRLRRSGLPPYLSEISPTALRIALERGFAWPARLYYQCWIDEVAKRSAQINAHHLSLRTKTADHVEATSLPKWATTRIHELRSYTESAKILLNDTNTAIHATEETIDVGRIIWSGRTWGEILDSLLTWSSQVRCSLIANGGEKISAEFSKFPDQIIQQIQTYPRAGLDELEKNLLLPEAEQTTTFKHGMVFEPSNEDNFNRAMDEYFKSLGFEAPEEE